MKCIKMGQIYQDGALLLLNSQLFVSKVSVMTFEFVQYDSMKAFTLIEISIVLVIIGLIVGGVLVGRDLISSAAVRAQISQIEKYQQAVNTFVGKYGYLPGDIKNPEATQFGFSSRGSLDGQGDGDSIMEGHNSGDACPGPVNGNSCVFEGELAMFWVDLSAQRLIDGSFTTATPVAVPSGSLGTTVARYLPAAKIKGYVYVWSGGYTQLNTSGHDSKNYFAVSSVTGTMALNGGGPSEVAAMSVSQAYSIDKKMDDGFPQYGNVMALSSSATGWALGGPTDNTNGNLYVTDIGGYDSSDFGPVRSGSGVATAATDYTCYDNGGVTDAKEQYSITHNGGRGVNCWLSFRFQ